MLSLFQQYLLEKKLISDNQRVLCAISGGLDSMVMLDLMIRSDIEIAVAHINHNTRGEESDGDHQFVKGYAKSQGIAFFDLTLDPEVKNRPDFQQTARDLRYAFFNEIASKHKYDLIATAHHSDDDVETFFINLLRGSGLNGLAGIPLDSRNIIRPLKFANRSQIENYASNNEVRFREDSSNKSDKYLRNDLRHNLIPILERMNPNARGSIVKSISNIASSSSVLKSLILEKYVEQQEGKLTIQKPIEKNEAGVTILYTILAEYGFNRYQLADLLSSDRISSKVFSKEWMLINESDFYVLIDKEFTTDEDLTLNEIGEYALSDGRVLSITKSSKLTDAYWFISSPFPLVIRSKKEGDRFRPTGMNGKSKSIKKYLTDIKMTTSEKSKALLVVQNNTILGIVNSRKSFDVESNQDRKMGFEIKIN